MGFHATQGNGQTARDKVRLRWSPNTDQPDSPVITEEFDPITTGGPEITPDYGRGTFTAGHGLTSRGLHLTDSVKFRKISPSREELRVQDGKLVLRKVKFNDVNYWVGEFVQTGSKPVVLAAEMIVRGEPSPKTQVKDYLLVRHYLAGHSAY